MRSQGQSFFARVVDVALYLLGRAFFGVMLLMPVGWAMAVARLIGSFGFLIMPRRRRLALANLDLAYGDSLTKKEKRKIAVQSFQHLVSVAVELVHLPRLCKRKDFWQRVVILHEERIKKALQEKDGIFLVTGHVGNWELSGYAAALLGYNFYAVARGRETPLLDRYMMSLRESSGMRIIYKEGAARKIVAALRDKGIIGFLIDQNAGREGVLVKFFGHDVSAFPTVAYLAARMNCAVIPAYAYRAGKGFKYVAEAGEPLQLVNTGNKDADLIENTQRMLSAIEAFVRQHPAQWLWAHRRWRLKESWLRKDGRLKESAIIRKTMQEKKQNENTQAKEQAD
jgi:KDO2-lipid IV(A) lauroyltransferase